MSALITPQSLAQDGQRKLLRDFRQLYKRLNTTPFRSDKQIISLMNPYDMGVRITTMRNQVGMITKENKHRVWNSIRTDIPVPYNDRQKVIDIVESLGLRPLSYKYCAEYDAHNPLLTETSYPPMKYPRFDSNGYLTPQGLEDEREKFVKEMQDGGLSQYLSPKELESEWWLNSTTEDNKNDTY